MRYGDIMGPLIIDDLELPGDMRGDPDVQRYIALLDKTMRAEKVSDPDDWTSEETAAYARGDYTGFSRLRGYSSEEIDDFQQYLDLCHRLIAIYGEDAVIHLTRGLEKRVVEGEFTLARRDQ